MKKTLMLFEGNGCYGRWSEDILFFEEDLVDIDSNRMQSLRDEAIMRLKYYKVTADTELKVKLHGPALLYPILLSAVQKIGCKLTVGVFIPTVVYSSIEGGYYRCYEVPKIERCEITPTEEVLIPFENMQVAYGNDEYEEVSSMWYMEGPRERTFEPEEKHFFDISTKKCEGKKVTICADMRYGNLVLAFNALLEQGRCKITTVNKNVKGEDVYFELT